MTKLVNIKEYDLIFMVSLREKRQIKAMYAAIKKFGVITPKEIQTECGNMSISMYNKLKPYLEEEYEGRMEYRRDRKLFVDLNPDSKDKEESIQQVFRS